jgi:hypothetical protein
MSNTYKATQMFGCSMVLRPHADEHPRVRVEGEPEARLAMAERIAAMLNGEEDPEIARLRQIIVDANNALFDGIEHDVEHMIACHPDSLPDVTRRVVKANDAAMALVSPVVLDLVGG